jgi:predicted MPP superfamily phosphohydrolase
MSFGLIIRLFFFLFFVLSILCGRYTVRWVSAFGATEASKKRLKLWGWVVWLLFNLPSFYFLAVGLRTRGQTHQAWQLWFLYPYFAWLVTTMVLSVILLAKTLVSAPFRIANWWRRRSGAHQAVLERREFLAKAATALPATLLLTSGYGILRAQQDFDWFEPQLKLRDWPAELEGFRIMQISDLHVGNFLSGDKLTEYIEAINQKSCDLMVVTGDIINNNMAWFPECLEALAKLKQPRYGSYVCIGNHDYYAGDPDGVLEGMRKLGMTVLRDEHVEVPVGNSRITVAGIDYPVWGRHGQEGGQLPSLVDVALAQTNPDLPTVLLAHHPHAFDRAAERGVQLTLSGHTHGGQFAFTPPGGRTVSLGDLMFKYVAGPYEKNGSRLYVNRGLGNWFPMRLGAPPEVTLITVG